MLIPLATAVLGGFKTNAQLLSSPFGWPDPIQLGNYRDVVTSEAFWRLLRNSTIVMLITAVGVVVLASMAAFVFARMHFPGRELLFNFFTLGLLFPLTVAILPLYITLAPGRSGGHAVGRSSCRRSPLGCRRTSSFCAAFSPRFPLELEEAAAIDGCGTFGFFWRMLLPLARPALAAVVVLTMVASWNNFLLPLLVLNNEQLYTLPLGIMQYQGQFGTDWARVLAFVSLALAPTLIFYLLAERHIVAGLTAGAIKG